MDHEKVVRDADDDQLKQVASSVSPSQQVARRVVTQPSPADCVLVGVDDVLVGDPVAPSRIVNLHTK